MNIFKSKEQREKDKKKKVLKKQISAIGTGGGRSNQATKKRLQRDLASIDKVKKEKPTVGGAQANKRKNYGNNQTGSGTTKTTTKKMTAKERAQAMAKKRIKAGKSIADVKAANKLKIKKRAAEKYAAFKKKRKK